MKETETQKAVADEAEEYSKQFGPVNHHERVPAYIAGRAKSLEEKEKEIERLKDLLKNLRHCGDEDCESCNNDWQQFKTENNL